MNILMILAHPDDEVIFGWPVLQQCKNNRITLLTMTHNRKKYGAGPEEALQEVCAINQIHLLDLPRQETNFYRLPPRYADLVLPDVINSFKSSIELAVKLSRPDFIFTHNPMGEYGHGDHRMLFNLVSMFNNQLLLTDICFSNRCHLSSGKIPYVYASTLYADYAQKDECELDMDWYNAMKQLYKKHKAWSWGGHGAIKECNLYKIT